MSEWLPPGYIRLSELVAEHGVDHMRTELYLGRFKVVRWNREYGTITEISSGFWISKDAVRWLTDGETSRIIDPRLVDLGLVDATEIVIAVVDRNHVAVVLEFFGERIRNRVNRRTPALRFKFSARRS